MSVESRAEQVLATYEERVKGFLTQHSVKVDALDRAAELLRDVLKRKKDFTIGFLGESQVGKSTLINALLGKTALPSGGVGPLTAQATRVSFGERCSFAVTYHSKQTLNELRFAIEGQLRRAGEHGRHQVAEDARGAEPIGAGAIELPEGDDESGNAQRAKKMQYLIGQARLLLCGSNKAIGDREPSTAELLDGIRAVLGQEPLDEGHDLSPFAERIEQLRSRLGAREVVYEHLLDTPASFDAELRLRAADWLAPLVSKLDVSLRSLLGQNVTLVDLPGIGVVGDPGGEVAASFVRREGDALVVVFRNNGMPETIAGLLEESQVITRLLFGGADGRPGMQLMVVVTYLDNVARDHFQRERTRAREAGLPPPDREAIFRQLSEEMARKIRDQVREHLRRSSAFENAGPEFTSRREQVIDQLCDSLRVYATSARDFLELSAGFEDEAFLKREDATGIPSVRSAIQSMANDEVERRGVAIAHATESLTSLVDDHLSALKQMYSEGGGPATANWERFRLELGKEAKPILEAMGRYHAESFGYLRRGLKERIATVCSEAEVYASKKLRRLRRHGEALHFASLNAALRRNGVWEVRSLNYPRGLTTAFVDAIASSWEAKVVEAVRAEVRKMAEHDLRLVEQLCDRARAHDARLGADAHIDVQKKILQQNARNCIGWTKEKLEALRANIHENLFEAVREPVERACRSAIDAGKNKGPGAKKAVLDAFEDGGVRAIERARLRAEEVMNQQYELLLGELQAGYFKEHHDPITAAFNSLTSEEIVRARRSDAKHRRQVLEEADRLSALLFGGEPGSLVAAAR